MRPGPKPKPLPDRIRAGVAVDARGCWLWQGARNHGGYGLIHIGSVADKTSRSALVHRVAYEQTRGAVPAGHELDHLCRVRHCCNPGRQCKACKVIATRARRMTWTAPLAPLLRGRPRMGDRHRPGYYRDYYLRNVEKLRAYHAAKKRAGRKRAS
jgi:hypothetical protein